MNCFLVYTIENVHHFTEKGRGEGFDAHHFDYKVCIYSKVRTLLILFQFITCNAICLGNNATRTEQ